MVDRWFVEAALERLRDMIDSLHVTGDDTSGLDDVASLLCDGLAGRQPGLTAADAEHDYGCGRTEGTD